MEKIKSEHPEPDFEKSLKRLRDGNLEYCSSSCNRSIITEADRKYHVENGQHPFACIVCCSDSRVVPEHIFSVGIGALFTIRTAGNVIGRHELASVEYAVLHLHTPLILVMGHTHCGAVAAALDGHTEGSMQWIASRIQNAATDKTDIRKCEWDNAEQGVKDITDSPALQELAGSGKVKVMAAMYDTENGRVIFRE